MWIVVTLVATVFQTVRTAAQGRLRSSLSVTAAGYVRYIFGAPLAIAACIIALRIDGGGLPTIPPRFWIIVTVAGIAQIFGTVALLTSFDRRDFAIGTVYSKSEVIQVAVFSAVLVGEPLRLYGWVAVMAVVTGVIMLAASGNTGASRPWRHVDRAAGSGLAAGAGFALAAVGIRWASTSLGDTPSIIRALITLAAMNSIQTIVNGLWLARTERGAIRKIVALSRRTVPVGILSVCGSAAWAIAMSLETAAKVRTLGQFELLLTFVVSRVWLREPHTGREYAASGLVLAGIVAVVVLG